MEKRKIFMLLAAIMLLLAKSTGVIAQVRQKIYFNVEKIDPSSGVPAVPKAPPSAPDVWVDGDLLEFSGDHPAYTLTVLDDAGHLVCNVEIPASVREFALPTTLREAFSIEFVQGSWRIYGRIAPYGYRPMVVDGKVWKGIETDADGNSYQCDYYIDADTLIDGKQYLKCYCVSERVNKSDEPLYIGALREINGSVYGVSVYETQEKPSEELLFDFNMQEGDSVFCTVTKSRECALASSRNDTYLTADNTVYTYYMKLAGIENVTSDDGVSVRCFNFRTYRLEYRVGDDYVRITDNPDTFQWIEGVGAGNYYPFYQWDFSLQGKGSYILEECYVKDKLFYSRASVTSVPSVPSVVRATSADVVFDLQGRRQSGKLPKGIYVRNGKKYVK